MLSQVLFLTEIQRGNRLQVQKVQSGIIHQFQRSSKGYLAQMKSSSNEAKNHN